MKIIQHRSMCSFESRSSVFVVFVLVVFSSIVVPPTLIAQTTITLRLTNWADIEEMPLDRQSIAEFERLHPTIKILYEPHERIHSAAEYIKAVVPVEKRKKMLLTWLAIHDLGKLKIGQDYGRVNALWFDQWLFAKTIRETFAGFGWVGGEAAKNTRLIRCLVAFAHTTSESEEVAANLTAMLDNADVRNFLGVNSYDDVWWFHKESFEALLGWIFILAVIGILKKSSADREAIVAKIEIQYQAVQRLLGQAAGAGYRLDIFRAALV